MPIEFDPTRIPRPEFVELAADFRQIGALAIAFSKIERLLVHEDGRHENDAEHSFMLALSAMLLAEKYQPHLDAGKVVQFAVIHDLVEVYADDTSSIGISAEGMADKMAREHAALERLAEEFADSFPELIAMIKDYEALDCAEARFVKIIDKIMPTVFDLNYPSDDGTVWGVAAEEKLLTLLGEETERINAYSDGQEFALELRASLHHELLKSLKPKDD